MKTMTIFSAYKISEDRLTKSFTVVCDGDPLTVIAYLKKYHRQANKFWNALVERMEAGDRAREALLDVEWVRHYEDGDICPWCFSNKHWEDHAQDCPRQIALGLQEPQP